MFLDLQAFPKTLENMAMRRLVCAVEGIENMIMSGRYTSFLLRNFDIIKLFLVFILEKTKDSMALLYVLTLHARRYLVPTPSKKGG